VAAFIVLIGSGEVNDYGTPAEALDPAYCDTMPTVRSLVWITACLVARPAAAHHPGGPEGGSWIWPLLGVACLLAGVAAWAFLGDEASSGESRKPPRASEPRERD
jgi:hypothetical protein